MVCDEGYSIVGAPRLQCLKSGQYAQSAPHCVKKPDLPIEQMGCGIRVVEEDVEGTEEMDYHGGALEDTDFEATTEFTPDGLIPVTVLHGNITRPGEFPWNVIIDVNRRQCGGSIIDEHWVLTASHCLLADIYKECKNQDNPPCGIVSPHDITSITAGITDREDIHSPYRQVRTAIQVIAHPYLKYRRTFIDFDVGLIRVNEPFQITKRVNRVCLPQNGIETLVSNKHLIVSGWGKTERGKDSEKLRKIEVPWADRAVCNSSESYQGEVTETMFCAGYPLGGPDACQGDSGGPLIYLGTNGTFVQGGIVSWGRDCGRPNFYGVYTNLAYFYRWISGYVGN